MFSILSELSEALSEQDDGSSMGDDIIGGMDHAGVFAGLGVILTSEEDMLPGKIKQSRSI